VREGERTQFFKIQQMISKGNETFMKNNIGMDIEGGDYI